MRSMENKSIIEKYVHDLLNESTPERPMWNIEKIREGKVNGWNYIDGCMMMGLLDLCQITGDEKFYDFAESYVDYYVFDDGTLRGYKKEDYNLDNICEGRVLFDLVKSTGKEKYSKAIELLYDQIKDQPRTEEGNFWHKAIYPNQVWLDGLFMAQVFYARYAVLHEDENALKDIAKQFQTVFDRMRDPETGLYRHGYDASKKAFWCTENGCSKNVWLRSLGWFSLALIDVLQYAGSYDVIRETLTPIAQDLAKSLLPYIDEKTHMLYQVPDQKDREGNYPETSGSSMIACFYMKGARLGILDGSYAKTGKQIFDGICDRYLTDTDGKLNLGGICLVAGLGPENNRRRDGSYEYYISEPVVNNDAKGTGPFLLSYTEVLRQG